MTSLNPLAPVTDYQSMLNRIFWFTSASALVAIWMLRLHNSALDELLSQIDFKVEFGGEKIFPIPGGYLLPALAIGMLTRIYRLHARISDALGIRRCFDIDVIIAEFSAQLEIDLSSVPYERLVEYRPGIMRTAFYPFVSGTHPAIDQQLVHQALDAWSWFWVGVEATLLFILAGFGLIAGGTYEVGFETIGGTVLLAAIGLPAMRGQCSRYAVAQVRKIAADPARAESIGGAFAALAQDRYVGRRAA
jgi:hypothetical protein